MARNTFKHLSYEQRLLLEEMLHNGRSKAVIAETLGFHRSAIYREIERGSINGEYNAEYAERLTKEKTANTGRQPIVSADSKLAEYISTLILSEKLSPEKIVEQLQKNPMDFKEVPLSATTIYAAIDRGLIPNVTRESLNPDTTIMYNDCIRFPNWFREKMQFKDGDVFHFESMPDGSIKLRKI